MREPGRNSTMAFIQANSAGSTMTALYLCKVSCKCLTSAATWLGLPVVVCMWIPEWGWGCGDNVKAVNSAELNRGDDSSGRHHCTAFRRKSSDQASSSSITYHGQDKSTNFIDFYFLEMDYFIEKDSIIFEIEEKEFVRYLIPERQTCERRKILGPLYSHEEQSSTGFVDRFSTCRRVQRGDHRRNLRATASLGCQWFLVRYVYTILGCISCCENIQNRYRKKYDFDIHAI